MTLLDVQRRFCFRPMMRLNSGKIALLLVKMVRLLAIGAAVAISIGGAASTDAESPTQLKQNRYLLVDPRLIADTSGVEPRLGMIEKHPANPLFLEDRPWEVRYDNVYANVVYDDDARLFKCWYSPFIVDECTSSTPTAKRAEVKYHVTPSREMGLCYAESSDGIRWTKPELGLVEWEGNKRNNILLRGIHGSGVILDALAVDPAQRFKLFAGSEIPGQKRFMIVSTSPDGLHWRQPEPCLEIGCTGDTHNNAIWMPESRQYAGFTREFLDQRMVMRTESSDFRNWTPAKEVLHGSKESQTYAMQVFPCCGIFLGMLAILDTQTDRVHGELAVSADTIQWDRICTGSALVPNSHTPGAYDYGCVYIAKSPVAIGDTVRIYYGASNAPHGGWRDGCLALAMLKRDRWGGYAHVKKSDSQSSGMVRTHPLVCTGEKLRVNIVAPQGSVRVGVVGHPDLSIAESQPIGGDDVSLEARWKSGAGLATLVGQEIQLEFEIQDGTLYAFEFVE